MAWDYGTITDANPADALMDKIEACMTDPAWTYEEQLTAGDMGGAYPGRIWGNSNGFHVTIGWVDPTTVYLLLAEGYNPSTNKCICPAMAGTLAVGADYSYGNSAEYTWVTACAYSAGVNTTGFTYAISATANYILVATLCGSTIAVVHAGKFDTLMASDPGPYGIYNMTTFCHTRVPNVTGSASFTGSLIEHTDSHGTPGNYDVTHNAIVLTRLRIPNRTSTDTHRGLVKGLVAMTSSGTYAFGDELDVSGTPKYKVLSGGTRAVEMV